MKIPENRRSQRRSYRQQSNIQQQQEQGIDFDTALNCISDAWQDIKNIFIALGYMVRELIYIIESTLELLISMIAFFIYLKALGFILIIGTTLLIYFLTI